MPEHRTSGTPQRSNARTTTTFLKFFHVVHVVAPRALPETRPLLQHQPTKSWSIQANPRLPSPRDTLPCLQACHHSLTTLLHGVALTQVLAPQKLTDQTAQLNIRQQNTTLGIRYHHSLGAAQRKVPLHGLLDGKQKLPELVALASSLLAHARDNSIH